MVKEGRDNNAPSIQKTLAIPAFRYLWIGQLCSQLGANMLLSILALRIYEVTHSNTAVSALYVAYGVPAVFFGMFAGVVVDHLDKRKVLAFCNISRSLLIIPLFFFPETLWLVYSVMFINSVISQFYLPAEAPLIPKLVSDKYLLSANSLFSFTFFTSMAFGFILAGPALKFLGAFGSFSLLFGLYIAAIWSVTNIPKQSENVRGIMSIVQMNWMTVVKRIMKDLKQGFDFVFRSKPVLDALVLLTGTQIVLAILGVLGPGFADKVLHIAVTDVSIVVLGPAVLGIILGALWVGTYGSKYKRHTLPTTGLFSAGTLLVMLSLLVRYEQHLHLNPIIMIMTTLILFFLLGFTNSFLDVPSNATLQQKAEGEMRGRIYGILTAAAGGVGILPVVGGGILADTIGVGRVLLLLGIGILGYGIIRTWLIRKTI